jgi:pantetheine-phosphate adenylyltransferase
MKLFFPGSFDPPTRAHFDIIHRVCHWAEKVYVGVGHNPKKSYWLSTEERAKLIAEEFKAESKVDVLTFSGLSVNKANELGANAILRGLRNQLDFEYERQIDLANRKLAPGLQTIYVVSSAELDGVSSSLCREIFSLSGNLDWALTSKVHEYLLTYHKDKIIGKS